MKIKLTYFNSTTKKNEDFITYDYVRHLKKFEFEREQKDLGLKYVVKIDNSNNKKIKNNLS